MEDFEALYARYFRGVYRFARSLCRSAALAEEITQETLHRALAGLEGFRGQSGGIADQTGVYYIRLLRPVLTLPWQSLPSVTTFLADMIIRDGLLHASDYAESGTVGWVPYGSEVTEIRVGDVYDYKTVYRQGGPIPLYDGAAKGLYPGNPVAEWMNRTCWEPDGQE